MPDGYADVGASADGYSVTVELDCGCNLRVNKDSAVPSFKPGDWSSCWQHSEIYGYDSSTGEPKYERDRRVVAVRRDHTKAEGGG